MDLMGEMKRRQFISDTCGAETKEREESQIKYAARKGELNWEIELVMGLMD